MAGKPCDLLRRLSPVARSAKAEVLPGAPFPKEFARFDRDEISRRTQIEKSTRTNVRHISHLQFLERFCVFADRRSHVVARLEKQSAAMNAGDRC
jgi:hypothetical protein